MIPDFMYSLKNEELYYEISDKLNELYELEKEEKTKLFNGLHNPPVLHTYRPNQIQIDEYNKELLKYEKELKEYKTLKNRLENSQTWKELINVYVSKCYSSSIPIGLIEKFIFNKNKNKKYDDIFQEYVEMLDWFEENSTDVKEQKEVNQLSIYKIKDKKPEHRSFIYIVTSENINSCDDIIGGEVEIHWFEYNKDDQFTGTQIVFENELSLPLFTDDDGSVYHYEKVYLVNGYELAENYMWFSQKELFNILITNEDTTTKYSNTD